MATYPNEVLADSPLRYYRMGGTGSVADTSGNGGANWTLISSPTRNVANGSLATDDGAISFNGTTDAAQVALDLSGTNIVTIEFWMTWDSNGTNDDFAMEHSASANLNNGFDFDWNNSTGGAEANTVSIKTRNAGGTEIRWTIAQPSAATWHHYVFVINRSTTTPTLTAYVDGSSVTVTTRASGNANGNFANDTLNIMCRNGNSLFGAGDMDELAIYTTALSSTRVTAHWNARSTTGGTSVTLTPATETDAAQGLSFQKQATLTPATETDTAQGLSVRKTLTLGTATETDAAQGLSFAKSVNLTPATETDTAQALSITHTQFFTLTPAVETDTAQGLSVQKQSTLTPATEADAAQALSFVKPIIVTLTPSTEVDAAQAITFTQTSGVHVITLVPATESDVAVGLEYVKAIVDRPANLRKRYYIERRGRRVYRRSW